MRAALYFSSDGETNPSAKLPNGKKNSTSTRADVFSFLMISRIVVPQAFENMEEATLGAWLKREGDAVSCGDALCDLITEKTTFSLESEAAGVLRRCVIAEKAVVPVGTILALIGDETDELPDADAENAALSAAKKSALPEPSAAPMAAAAPASTRAQPTSSSAPTRLRATPAARRAAKDRGVALEDVARAFPDKVLSETDVNGFAEGNAETA